MIAYATLAAVVTLAFGAAVQPLVPRLARRVGGASGGGRARAHRRRHAAPRARRAPWARSLLALLAAAVRATAYGICILTGLVETQVLADPERVAGLTGVYYSLIYVGFLLPAVLSELVRVADENVLLVVVAAVCAACAVAVARGLRTTSAAADPGPEA